MGVWSHGVGFSGENEMPKEECRGFFLNDFVLVRNGDKEPWEVAKFAFKYVGDTGAPEWHTIGGQKWRMCIRFSESLIGKCDASPQACA